MHFCRCILAGARSTVQQSIGSSQFILDFSCFNCRGFICKASGYTYIHVAYDCGNQFPEAEPTAIGRQNKETFNYSNAYQLPLTISNRKRLSMPIQMNEQQGKSRGAGKLKAARTQNAACQRQTAKQSSAGKE